MPPNEDNRQGKYTGLYYLLPSCGNILFTD
jgi:hypothetical protein